MVNIETLIRLATLVRDETGNKLNTAIRVGGALLELVLALRDIIDTTEDLDSRIIATNGRTRHLMGVTTDPDSLHDLGSLGIYGVWGGGWRGLLSVQFDAMSNVSQVALSSSTPSYSGGSVTWLSNKPCVMTRTYTNGAWSNWSTISGGLTVLSEGSGDLEIADEAKKVILRLENGHVRTKNFYSGNVYTKTEVDALIGSGTGGGVTPEELATALSTKQNTLVSGTNIKTVGGVSILGSGNITIGNYWLNKKVEWDGDSISYGSWLTSPRQTAFPVLVASALGMTLKNYAIGSSRLVKLSNDDYESCFVKYSDWTAAVSAGTVNTSKQYLVYDGNSDSRPYQMYKYTSGSWQGQGNSATTCKNYPIVDRIVEMDLTSDLFVIAAGTNDFYTNCPLGTVTDEVKTTFYGALNIICKYLVQNTTNKNILFITPIKRYQGLVTLPDSPNTLGLTLKQYRDAIIERCDYYSIPVLDMWSVSGMNPSFNTALFADTDGKHVHPNVAGHERMASFVIGYLKSLRG